MQFSLSYMNLLLIFLILPQIIMSLHHRDFSTSDMMKIRLRKFHNSSTSQSQLITYSTDVSLIIPLILSLHHRENVSTTPSVQRWTYKTHKKSSTQPISRNPRKQSICNQTILKSMTKCPSFTRIFPRNL